MALKRYLAIADNTIVNAYKEDLQTRGTGSNTGYSDIVEAYSIYGRQDSGSQELSRILMKFPVTDISADRAAGDIPSAGSVSFYLRLFDAQHTQTVPEDYKLVVSTITRDWEEGTGLDLEYYTDETFESTGSNWMRASKENTWTSPGGDYNDSVAGGYSYVQTFENGLEDLELDITTLVEKWLDSSQANYGVGIRLSASYEAYATAADTAADSSVITNLEGAIRSFYTKRFFARGTQYFFKRPVIEARWNSRVIDDRGNFYYSSSLAPAEDNVNTLYLYNYVRGRLANIPQIGTTGSIMVSLYSGSVSNTAPSGSRLQLYNGATSITGGYVSTGIYSCSVGITASSTPLTKLFDVWHSGTLEDEHAVTTEFFTGSITPVVQAASFTSRKPTYFLNITNNRGRYRNDETARFNLYVRNKNWNPTIYTVARTNVPTTTIESASYRVYRTLDGYEAIPYGTGSDLHTLLSHDVSGNYFDLDMSLLEPGYQYAVKFAFYEQPVNSWSEQPHTFTFRVEEYEY